MSDWVMVLKLIATYTVKYWSLMMQYWFVSLPIFAAVIFNIIKLIWSISPNSDNRKT